MYKMVYVFPIADVVQALKEKLPPWKDGDEMAIISSVIKYWIKNDLYLALPSSADDHLVYKWTELTNDFDTAMKLFKLLEGPCHPRWFPPFEQMADRIKITSRSLYLIYNIGN